MKQWIVVLSLWIVHSLKGDIVLSEIMFNPAGSEYTDEFVEIYNRGDTTVSLEGCYIGDGTSDDEIMDAGFGLWLKSNQYALVFDSDYFENADSYEHLIPDSALILSIGGSTLGSGGLSNSNPETIVLFNSNGNLMDSHTYSVPNENGYSEERVDLFLDEDENNWADSNLLNGTPGFRNSVARVNFDLTVTSFFTDSQYADDASLLFHAIIQNIGCVNAAGFDVNFFIDSNLDSILQREEIVCTVSELSLSSGDSMDVSGEWIKPASGNHHVFVVVDFVNDEKISNNSQTIEVFIPYTAGSIFINEVMANPLAGYPEWIELYVPEEQIMNLNGWKIMDQDSNYCVLKDTLTSFYKTPSFILVSEDAFILDCYSIPLETSVLIPDRFPSLNNTGDSVFLLDPTGKRIDGVQFCEEQVSESGISLERMCIPGLSEDPQNWLASTAEQGATPGAVNSVYVDVIPSQIHFTVTPDPFSPNGDGFEDETVVDYILPTERARVRLLIFDARGRRVRSLLNGALSGSHRALVWDGLDDSGNPARMGIYVLYLEVIDDSKGKVWQRKKSIVLARKL